jgi:hypothetical protein
MSGVDFTRDIERALVRLDTDIQILLDAAKAGVAVTVPDLERLRASVEAIFRHLACPTSRRCAIGQDAR